MGLDAALAYFWHPVCTLDELDASAPHPLAIELLGRDLAVADLGSPGDRRIAAVTDRCPHRSTRLSVGRVEAGSIRCAYHGWRWGSSGLCLEIPAVPDARLGARMCVDSFDADIAYGLVWVRLDSAARTAIPPHPGWGDPAMKVLAGNPYTWPTSAPRRVENFVDLAHFAWVHDGTLGRRDDPVPQIPEVRRQQGELRFDYQQPPELEPEAEVLYGFSRYRMPMPLTVNIDFSLLGGARRHLWMTASPLDSGRCRSFWHISRDDDLDGDDAAHLAFQDVVLAEDAPVVCSQHPPEIPLDAGVELSVRTDRVSMEYRRWLRELADASGASDPADAVHAAVARESPIAA